MPAAAGAAIAAGRRRSLRGSAVTPWLLLLPSFASLGAVSLFPIFNGLWLSSQADDNWRNFTLTGPPPVIERHERVIGLLQSFRRVVQPGAKVATAWAGIPAYFTDYRMIDILGFNDRVVARMAPVAELNEENYRLFRPGHVKWNERRLLRRQRPDAFFQIWGVRRGMGRVVEVLPRYGYRQVAGFWVRADSRYLHPEAVTAIAASSPTAADLFDLRHKRRLKRRARALG